MFKKLLVLLLPLVTLVGCKSAPVKTDMLYIKCLSGETSIGYSYDGDDVPMNLEWSKDFKKWSPVNIVGGEYTIADLKSGETISFRGNNPDGFNKNWFSSGEDEESYRTFIFTFDNSNDNIELEIGGNVMSLLSTDNFANMVDIPSRGCFFWLFYHFGKAEDSKKGNVDASKLVLPATQLKDYAYYSVFGDSTITKSPLELPATNAAIGCYSSMFDDCCFLTTAPVIKLENLLDGSCSEMFDGCSNLNITKGSGGTKIFTCPNTSADFCVNRMFNETKQKPQDDPAEGEVFYYN